MKTIKEQTIWLQDRRMFVCVCLCACVCACLIEFTDSDAQNAIQRLASVCAQCIPRGIVCDETFSGSSVTKKKKKMIDGMTDIFRGKK